MTASISIDSHCSDCHHTECYNFHCLDECCYTENGNADCYIFNSNAEFSYAECRVASFMEQAQRERNILVIFVSKSLFEKSL